MHGKTVLSTYCCASPLLSLNFPNISQWKSLSYLLSLIKTSLSLRHSYQWDSIFPKEATLFIFWEGKDATLKHTYMHVFYTFSFFPFYHPWAHWTFDFSKLKTDPQIEYFPFFIISQLTVHWTSLGLRGGPCWWISCKAFYCHSFFLLHSLMSSIVEFYDRRALWGPHVRSKLHKVGVHL